MILDREAVCCRNLNEKVEFLMACAYADAKDAQCATAEYKLGVAGARTLTSAVDSKCR